MKVQSVPLECTVLKNDGLKNKAQEIKNKINYMLYESI